LNGKGNEFPRQGHQFVQPERFATQLRTERPDFGHLCPVYVVVPGGNGHWRVGQPRDGPDRPQELWGVGQRHSQIEDDGLRSMSLGQAEAGIGRQRSPYFVALESQYS